jgi:hypothetical protein
MANANLDTMSHRFRAHAAQASETRWFAFFEAELASASVTSDHPLMLGAEVAVPGDERQCFRAKTAREVPVGIRHFVSA